MEYFDRKFLLFSENSAEASLWSVNLTKVGLLESNVEVQNINIVSKLQDKTYDACIILAKGSQPRLIHTVLAAIQTNRLASLVPVVVVAPGIPINEVSDYYDNGATYVDYGKDSTQSAKEVCHILENILVLLEKYKMGRDNRYLR